MNTYILRCHYKILDIAFCEQILCCLSNNQETPTFAFVLYVQPVCYTHISTQEVINQQQASQTLSLILKATRIDKVQL